MQPPATFRLNELSVKLLVERGDPTRCWIDEEWPGQVEVHLRVSDSSTATLTDKAPVFDGDDVLIPGAELPMDIEIPCDILSRTTRTATVRLHFALEDGAGKSTFDVSENDVIARS